MVRLGSPTEPGVLDLDEVPDAHAVREVRVRAQVGRGADLAIAADLRLFDRAVRLDPDAVPESRVLDDRSGIDPATRADPGGAAQHGTGGDHGVGTDLYIDLDVGLSGLDQRHALAHPALRDPLAHGGLGLRQVRTRVHAECLGPVLHRKACDAATGFRAQLEQIREIELALPVLVSDLCQRLEQELGLRHVRAQVDLGDGADLVLGLRLLHDALRLAIGVAHHASVALGLWRVGGEERQIRGLRSIRSQKCCEGRRAVQGVVPVRDQAGSGGVAQQLRRLQCGVARAELPLLTHELYLLAREGIPQLILASAHDHDDPLRADLAPQPHRVEQDRPAADGVKHLGQARAHPGPLPRCQQDQRELA